MRYPTIHQYLESMNNPEGLFRSLGEPIPVRDLYGELFFRVGNFAVIFKIRHLGQIYALKCYTRPPGEAIRETYRYMASMNHPYLTTCRFLESELYVYNEQEVGFFFPAVQMDWIEGESLGRRLDQLTQKNDITGLTQLADRFDRLALWLLRQPFAHGDLKLDNILVTPSGELRLIDLDGAYIPSFEGMLSGTIGSPAYQHPERDEFFFNKHLDDYSLALISFNLRSIAREPALFVRRRDKEHLPFCSYNIPEEEFSSYLTHLENSPWTKNEAWIELGRLLQTPSPMLPTLHEYFHRVNSPLQKTST